MSICKLKIICFCLLVFCSVPAVGLALNPGDMFPPLPATTLEGEMYNLGQLSGKPVLLMLGTSWCPYCLNQTQQIEEIRPFLEENGIVFADVFFREEAAIVKEYFIKNNLQKPDLVLLDEGVLGKALSLKNIPRLILIDKDSRVYRDGAGLTASSLQEELTKMIAAGAVK